MSIAKLWVKTFLLLYFFIGITVFAFLSQANFYGDLTRIGELCEYMFGWRAPKPKINPKLLKSSSFKESDIVVIGDSFSKKLMWQTRLTEANYKVKTLDWQDLENAICSDFGEILINNNFKGSTIIIESVQRNVDMRILASIACHNSKPLLDHEVYQDPPLTLPPNFGFNLKENIKTGIKAVFNTVRVLAYLSLNDNLLFRAHQIFLKKLDKGCEWFSNRACNIGVFYNEDIDTPRLSENTLNNIKKINATLQRFNVIWLIVPDKSSIYTEKNESGFWKTLEKNNLGPDLLDNFIKKREKVLDLYLPNDTHLSSVGSLFMGDLVKQWIETH